MLNFGTFLSRLKETMLDSPTTENVVRLLFDTLIDPNDLHNVQDEPFDVSKETASKLLNNKMSVPRKIKKLTTSLKDEKFVRENFIDCIVTEVTPGREDDLLNYLSNDISQDDSIAPAKKNIFIQKAKKELLAEFLADVFLYTLKKSNKATKIKASASTDRIEAGQLADIVSKSIKAGMPVQKVDLSGFHAKTNIPAKEFINREEHMDIFYRLVESQPPYHKNVIMYYGIGGIGKSSLVRNLKCYAEEHSIQYASVDFDDPENLSPYKALIELRNKISTLFPHFDIAVTLYFIKKNPEFLSTDSGLPNKMSRNALALLHSSSSITSHNATSGLIEKIYSKFNKELGLDDKARELLRDLEECSATDIERRLPDFFALDLYRHMKMYEINSFILFFDTYELLWKDKRGTENKLQTDEWIRTLAEKLENVIFVLSGREKLQWEADITWKDKITHVALDVLPFEYARQFLNICKIESEEVQNNIIKASQGHPYYLDLCVDTYYKLRNANKSIQPNLFIGGFAQIQERFFRSLADNEINMLRVLSVPRFYDSSIFDELSKQFQTGYSILNIETFNAFSFIKHDIPGTKYIIHTLMRDEIKKQMAPDLLRSINDYMITFFESKLSRKKLPIDEICYYFSELLYHLLASGSDKEMLLRIETDFIGIVKRLQKSGETRYLLNHLLNLFYANRNSIGGTELFAVMVDMIHLSGKYEEAVSLVTEYLSGFGLDEIASDRYRLNFYMRRAHHQAFYLPLHKLGNDLHKIISIIDKERFFEQYCEIWFMLGGRIYLTMGNIQDARTYLQSANNFAKSRGLLGLLSRGLRRNAELLCAEEKYACAEKVCLKGIQIAEEEELWRYAFYLRCIFGEINRLKGSTSEALKHFNEEMPIAVSLGIEGWVGHIHFAIGNCQVDLGNYEIASRHYAFARNIYTNIGQKWGMLNLETAYQRLLIILTGTIDKLELERLKYEADELRYTALSKKIVNLMAGDKSIIRFDYL